MAAVIVSDWGGGVSESSVWLARALVIAGGSATGILAPRTASIRGRVAALAGPIPLLAAAGVLMAGLSQSADDLPEVGRILGIALLLFDLPMAVVFGIRALGSARRGEMLFAPAGTVREEDTRNQEQDLDLDRDTVHGRAATVVSEYPEDERGKAHLGVDAAPGWLVAVINSAKFGCLSVGLIVAWTAAGVTIMIAGFLVLGAVDPNQGDGNPIRSVPPLLGLVVASLGSILSIRWLRARG
ncbi:MAG: hypothetical protein AB1736_00195 [Chloroflexota bacterium]